ncbi:PP2C family protein-serine/threonine phosphatase [Nocardioides yefusunii]|uniref:PP2C family protein-serine/threonine phosphatase n=1 Tax=Nocardioides yefusunii TaxID=2500546 RepID=A0ABW1R0I9_9ACTN|nr:protein phosphatase 2C domain-containing protein [Nocardioides yefusunii]
MTQNDDRSDDRPTIQPSTDPGSPTHVEAEPTVMRPIVPAPRTASLPDDVVAHDLRLDWSALSDVGRVRKDNQDSGYAGEHLLVVCDGVGGAARGDIASSTAVRALRRLDEPGAADGLERVAGAIQRATDMIGELAEQDESLSGTSTTATVALFDGGSIHLGHVGDSRAYLLRDGVLTQLTHDHTFVQSLVDEGRITEAEARVHPHRNLILKAVDGVRDPEPDLFSVPLRVGDRLLLCSDGACGVLDDTALTVLLAEGTPDFAAVELVQSSLEAGSSDNVTCVVADVIAPDATRDPNLSPLLVGAAADQPRLPEANTSARVAAVAAPAAPAASAGTAAAPSAPLDEELVRYAPREPRRFDWLKRIFITVALLGLVWVAGVAAWSWSQKQFYVGEHEGAVTIFRGVDASLPGIELSQPYETSNVLVTDLAQYDADLVRDGITAKDLTTARDTVDNLGTKRVQ